MKNSKTKAHYVTDGKLDQLERYCDLFRTIAVLNTIPGNNINIKEIIGNYECSSLARTLFDASGLRNHGGDGKSDLVHAVCNSLDGAWIHLWRDKLHVVVIDAMGAIFHLPKSTKFESFQMLSSSFINYIVKETSTSSTVIISFDSYCKNSLKALTRERRKGHQLSVQYDIIESTHISNVSIKELLSGEKAKQGLTQFLEKQVINQFKEARYFFCSCWEWKNHIKNSNSTVDVASNNHEESETLMRYCLGLVDLENKVVCVMSTDTDVFTIMLGNY